MTTQWFSDCAPKRNGEYECCMNGKGYVTRRFWNGVCWSRSYMPQWNKEYIDKVIAMPEAAYLQKLITWRGLTVQP